MTRKTLEIAAGVMLTISTTIATGAFLWVWNANAELRLLRAELDDQRKDESRDRQLRGLWRYTGSLHHQINELRSKAGLPLVETPRFD